MSADSHSGPPSDAARARVLNCPRSNPDPPGGVSPVWIAIRGPIHPSTTQHYDIKRCM